MIHALLSQMEGMMGDNSPQEYDPDANASALNYITDETIAKVAAIPGIKPDSVKFELAIQVFSLLCR